jgi:NADH-quinone oxidoreductase subunit C
VTDSPSEPTTDEAGDAAATDARAGALAEWTELLADLVGAERWVAEFDTARVYVDRADWISSLRKARDEAGLVFFSWLSAVDWSREVAVGEPVEEAEGIEERFEVMARVSSIKDASGAHFIAVVPKDDPSIDSIVSLWPCAEWHEREAAEMFGIDFVGNPNLTNIYLPDSFEGYPLLKSYPLLSREVKPWPGTVDVENMPEAGPSTENPEAAPAGAAEEGSA